MLRPFSEKDNHHLFSSDFEALAQKRGGIGVAFQLTTDGGP